MISKRARVVRSVTGAYFALTDAKAANVHLTRRRWHVLANLLPTACGVRLSPDRVNGLDAEWLTPKNAPQDKLIVYLHGGAYIMGGCPTHRQLVSHIARAAGIRALLPEYRLAPEYPFPAAIDDAVAVYRSLLASGMLPEDIVLAGDSAGGGLVMATMLSLRDAADPLPAAACMLSPWLDLAATGETMATHADSDPWFQAEDLAVIARYYCAGDELRNPLVSPVYADVSGLPPLFIQVGGDEILLSDATRLADKVRSCGGTVEIEVWPGMWHVFQAFIGKMPESRRAVDKIGAYIRCALNHGEKH